MEHQKDKSHEFFINNVAEEGDLSLISYILWLEEEEEEENKIKCEIL